MNPQQTPPSPSGVEPQPPRPVAYDANNQPLYAAPETPAVTPQPPYVPKSHVTIAPEQHEGHNFDPRMRAQYANEPHIVHHERSYEPDVGGVSDELKAKHEKSRRMYPNLNLSEGEFVVLDIKRHPIGLILPTAATTLGIFALLFALVSYPTIADASSSGVGLPGIGTVTIILLCLILLIGIGGYIAVWVYLQNTFYLTNESVIQEIQHGIFSKHEQTVSLGSIEDASFKQFGIFQSIFNYGTIRLSTEGEETTYRFQYVANPKEQIAIVNNAIESFKNGRPVGMSGRDDDMN